MRFKKHLKNITDRFLTSNNRTLATFFGCIGGLIVGTLLVSFHTESLPLVGKAPTLSLKIIGIILATGTGGNLSSYIGASIDLVTGEKTLIDLGRIIYKRCGGKLEKVTTPASELRDKSQPARPLTEKKKQPFPFINTQEQTATQSNFNGEEESNTQQLSQHSDGQRFSNEASSSSSHILSRLNQNNTAYLEQIIKEHAEQKSIIEHLHNQYSSLEQLVNALQAENQQLKVNNNSLNQASVPTVSSQENSRLAYS